MLRSEDCYFRCLFEPNLELNLAPWRVFLFHRVIFSCPRWVLYGVKSNLPENFDPSIGSRPRRKPASRSSLELDTINTVIPPECSLSSGALQVQGNTESENPSEFDPTPERSPSPESVTSDIQPTMVVGPFPPLNSVREIKEFDGTTEKLSDFLTSVEAHLAAYNIPLSKGGYVGGDVDEGWTFASVEQYQANAANFKRNYNYGERFSMLLAEIFIGAA